MYLRMTQLIPICPMQIRELFKRVLIVGRRFPICMVNIKGSIIEVVMHFHWTTQWSPLTLVWSFLTLVYFCVS